MLSEPLVYLLLAAATAAAFLLGGPIAAGCLIDVGRLTPASGLHTVGQVNYPLSFDQFSFGQFNFGQFNCDHLNVYVLRLGLLSAHLSDVCADGGLVTVLTLLVLGANSTNNLLCSGHPTFADGLPPDLDHLLPIRGNPTSQQLVYPTRQLSRSVTLH